MTRLTRLAPFVGDVPMILRKSDEAILVCLCSSYGYEHSQGCMYNIYLWVLVDKGYIDCVTAGYRKKFAILPETRHTENIYQKENKEKEREKTLKTSTEYLHKKLNTLTILLQDHRDKLDILLN